MPATIVRAGVGVWKAIFFGQIMGIIMGVSGTLWPVYWMNYYHCWQQPGHPVVDCGDGDWGTKLWIAKWGGTMTERVIGTFVGAISGPAGEAMISMQVSQTEQASIQAAFRLVSSLAGMWAPL